MRTKYALEPGVRALLVDMGVSPTAVLRSAGLRTDLLSGGPVWLSADEFFALWTSLEAEVDHPNLPLLVEQAFAPGVFSPSMFAATMSADLNTAAHRMAIYKRLVDPLQIRVDVAGDRTTIGLDWPSGHHPPDTMNLTELMFWVALARVGTRERVVPLQMTTPSPPADAAAYRDYLGVDIEAADHLSVVFAAVDAARPFLTANEAIWEAFEPQLRRRLADLELDAPIGDRVGAVLLELLPVGRTTVPEVAAELAMSTRTLHRQLKAQGASYQEILNSTREQLARHYLQNPSLSAAEIAFLLGYEETSSFYRAFQSWTGETPEQVRRAAAS